MQWHCSQFNTIHLFYFNVYSVVLSTCFSVHHLHDMKIAIWTQISIEKMVLRCGKSVVLKYNMVKKWGSKI